MEITEIPQFDGSGDYSANNFSRRGSQPRRRYRLPTTNPTTANAINDPNNNNNNHNRPINRATTQPTVPNNNTSPTVPNPTSPMTSRNQSILHSHHPQDSTGQPLVRSFSYHLFIVILLISPLLYFFIDKYIKSTQVILFAIFFRTEDKEG